MIPLFGVSGNKLTSLQGEVSSFYEVLPPDLEGLSEDDQDRVLIDLEKDLINNEGLLKIYWRNGRVFINTFSEFSISNGELIPKENPVATFRGIDQAKITF